MPEPYSTWRDQASDRREGGPLYNIPLLTLYGIGFSGVALGLADASLRAFMTLAQTKKPGGGLGSQQVLRDNAVIQSKVAQATGRLAGARALLHESLRDIWETSSSAGTFSLEQRAMLRVAITGAMDNAREVVDFAYHAAGTTGDLPGQRVRAPLPRPAHRAGARAGASVEFRGGRAGAVRRRADATALENRIGRTRHATDFPKTPASQRIGSDRRFGGDLQRRLV